LGSKSFKERDAAAKALEAIGQPALPGLREAEARGADAEIRRRAHMLVQLLEQRLDALLVEYQAHGLPLPPASAPLVRFATGWVHHEGGKPVPFYQLAFLLRPAAPGSPPVLLVGTQGYSPEPTHEIVRVRPEPDSARGVELAWRNATFGLNAGLATALQCKARGWDALAQALWDASIKEYSGHPFGIGYQPPNLPPRTALACLAWAHWCNELLRPATDRAQIARRMRQLLEGGTLPVKDEHRALLKSLQAALVPSNASPGSPEAAIDELLELCPDDWSGRGRSQDDAYWRLVDKGFDAVPALIDHLDDERLTRTVLTAIMNSPPYHRRVGDIVTDLLRGLAGEETPSWPAGKADAQRWWDRARAVGEEAYVRTHVLPRNGKQAAPNVYLLRLMTRRYPQHLPALYKAVLDKQRSDFDRLVVDALGSATLPSAQKAELFRHALKNKDRGHRWDALQGLKELGPRPFADALIELLGAMPATPSEPYWRCWEASLAEWVPRSQDPRVWHALGRAARRADVGLRMELLDRIATSSRRSGVRLALAFVASFLEDTSVPDTTRQPELFAGPRTGSRYPELAVRDLAAWDIAYLLRMPEKPEPEWTAAQWATLRAKAKQAVP
jgi:hypothetical protein